MKNIHSRPAEDRRVPLKGAVNFRDVGGLATADSLQVKRGLVYRADHLSRLTDSDHQVLRQLDLKSVCDLRSPAEQQKSPDRLPHGGLIRLYSFPVQAARFDPAAAMERLENGDKSWLSMEFNIALYRCYLDDFAQVWSRIYTMAASASHLPLAFHCTGGKDRTGICAALLLKLLAVDEETIFAEHLLSNTCNAERLKPIYARFAERGVSKKQAALYLQAPLEPLVDLFEYLHKKYHTVEDYLLTRGTMQRHTLEQLQKTLHQ